MKKFLYIFLLITGCIYAEESSGLRYSGEITYFGEEEEEREKLYTLKIRGEIYAYNFPVITENNINYLPVLELFNVLGFKNYQLDGKVLKMELGKELIKKEINFNRLSKEDYIYEAGEYFLSEDIYKELFADEILWNNKDYVLTLVLRYIIPKEIDYLLDAEQRRINEEMSKPELFYKGERNLIDAGNVRVNLEQRYNSGKYVEKKKDWDGYLEYSGSLLYGVLNTSYDLKEKEWGDFEIRYSDILDGYELDIGVYGDEREKGLSLSKDRGFYSENDTYIIRQNVPLGSRVELIYAGAVIEVKNEENGEVIFVSNLIKRGREFTLKIYDSEGRITEKIIRINEDFNQQKKGEFGYDIYMRENSNSHRYDSEIDIYYGYTDKLTFGFGYDQNSEEIAFKDGKTKYIGLRSINLQSIYSDSIDGNPYTLTYELKKGLNMAPSEYDEESRKVDRKYNNQHRFMFDTVYKDLTFNYELYKNGKYYDAEREQYLDIDYNITDWISFSYEYENTKYYDEPKERDYRYGFDISKSYKSLLTSYEIERDRKGDIIHNLDFYYTGLKYIIARLENSWDEDGKYEGELSIMNKSWSDTLEYSFKTKYSRKEKEVYSFDVTVKLDNWFEIGSYFEKDGDRSVFVGIDRVVNLKNPTKNMNSLENSVIKAIAFIDGNNNNKMDKGEVGIEDIEIEFGKETVVTNENGIAYFYGIASYTDYELKATSRRPSFKSDANRIKVRGMGSSEIVAYIPIKPVISLTGIIDIENISKDDKPFAIAGLKVNITDEKRSYYEAIYPDYDGMFYLFDLQPGRYIFDIEYIGEDFNIHTLHKEVDLIYTEENRGDNEFEFILKKGDN